MASAPFTPRDRGDFRVALICALSLEAECVQGIFDKFWEDEGKRYGKAPGDINDYTPGVIDGHNVVLAYMPSMGLVSAAAVAGAMRVSYPNIKLALVVGICGGMPYTSDEKDIMLGDVIISQALIQYDFGRQYPTGFQRKTGVQDTLGRSSPEVRSVQNRLGTSRYKSKLQDNLIISLERIQQKLSSACSPGPENDILYQSSYIHQHHSISECNECDKDGYICAAAVKTECEDLGCKVTMRETRKSLVSTSTAPPTIHFGVVGSGNTVMKSGYHRDRLAEADGIIALEMEGAGVCDYFPSVVIKGVCDYADSHKRKGWQRYAAATAAACAKAFLIEWVSEEGSKSSEFSFGVNIASAPDIDASLFVGRKEDLESMASLLLPDVDLTNRKTVILGGLGGIGKTQLAIHFIKSYGSSYDCVFWLNASSETALDRGLRLIAIRIGLIDSKKEPLEDNQLRAQVLNWFSAKQNTRWLLVFDNYDDTSLYNITDFYPFAWQGSIIVTTRSPDHLNGGKIHLGKMREVSDALRILETRSGRKNIDEDVYARQLARRMDGLPLALATAGSYLRQSAISVADYLRHYEEQWTLLQSVAQELPEYQARTLYTTWDLSLIQMQKTKPEMAEVLALLAYFDNQEVWYQLFAAGNTIGAPTWYSEIASSSIRFESTMKTLVDFGLAEVQVETSSYSFHVCVHDWMLHRSNRELDSSRFQIAFSCVTNLIADMDLLSVASLPGRRRLTPHCVWLCHDQFQDLLAKKHEQAETQDECQSLAVLLGAQYQFKHAESQYLRLISVYEKVLGSKHHKTLDAMQNLAFHYWERGQTEQAQTLWVRALEGYETTLGPDQPGGLGIRQNLGLLYWDRGQKEQARTVWTRALAGYERLYDRHHHDTLKVVQNLALLYLDEGQYEQAETMWTRALTGLEEILEPDALDILLVVQNLGYLNYQRGQMERAEAMWTRALAGCERTLEPNHHRTLLVMQNMGLLYHHRGQLEQAEAIWTRALTGCETTLESDHSTTLLVMANLGELYSTTGQIERAERLLSKALAGCERTLEPGHSTTLSVRSNLGRNYYKQGQMDRAERVLSQALDGCEKALRPGHAITLIVMQNLGAVYHKSGLNEQAESICLRALRSCELSKDNLPQMVELVSNLSSFYDLQNKFMETIELCQRELQRIKIAGLQEESCNMTVLRRLVDSILQRDREHAPRSSTNGNSLAVVVLSKLARDWGDLYFKTYRALGEVLLRASDSANANIAFQHQAKFEDGERVFRVVCDGCERRISYTMKRFVCRQCADVDLCGKCHETRHGTDGEILGPVSGCSDHEFLEVRLGILSPSNTILHFGKRARDMWLDFLLKRYSVVEERPFVQASSLLEEQLQIGSDWELIATQKQRPDERG